MPTRIPDRADLAILGGGINGAGLAALAAYQGLSVVLFEKGDFSEGASSRSTKLIHGGIRYLEQGRLPLVFEALQERRQLLAAAPHLVRPLPFLLPVYRGDARPLWKLKTGLWLYDLLAGSRNLSRHGWLGPGMAHDRFPSLKGQDLLGCGVYYDAQVNDARLVLENILAAEAAGAHCLDHCPITGVLPSEEGFQLRFRSKNGTEGVLRTDFLVNATGAWANRTSGLLPSGPRKWVRPTRGTHVVVPQVLADHAVLLQSPEDGRILFVIPWRGATLLGTTDLDEPGDPDKVRPTEEEIRYLLRLAARFFPTADWGRGRVLSAFCGLRPLAWSEEQKASSISREDRIVLEGRVLTIVGGKLTTYRSMARKALQSILKALGKRPSIPPFPGFPGTPSLPWKGFLEKVVPGWRVPNQVDPALPFHLAHLYGQRAEQVLSLLRDDPKLREPLQNGGKDVAAQVAFAVREEKARHLSDVMFRRLELGYGPQRWGPTAETVSRIMSRELDWSEEKRSSELDAYRNDLFPPPEGDTPP